MHESRKLATIVFADIAGYSAMMQANEQNALVIIDRFKTTLERGMTQAEGRIIQFFGDGCLLAFDSAVVALNTAAALQLSFIEQEIPVRIGMHLGDVLFKNNNAFGDGVNVASRVESLGIPGCVLLSKAVRDQVKNKTEFTLDSIGQFQFKNIAEKMEVYAVSNPGFIVPQPHEMRGKLEVPPKPTMSLEEQKEWERYQMLEMLDAIEEGKCVLILGNYAFSRPGKNGLNPGEEVFLPELLQQEQEKITGPTPADLPMDFYSMAQTFMNRAGGQRRFMKLADIKWDDLGPVQRDRYRKISEIPFDLILSTYPFDLVHQAFLANQIPHQYDYYSFMKEGTEPEPFDTTMPLIYNLFGSKMHKESMVISLERLYQFIFAVMGARQLPKLIQDKVQQATHLVFLGFSFDDWYMKLLLRVLKVHEKDISYAHPPGKGSLLNFNQMFFESNFKVTFLDRKIDTFITELHGICEEEGLIRRRSTQEVSPFKIMNNLVAKYRFAEALDIMDALLLGNDAPASLLREIGDLYRRYHKIKDDETYERQDADELEESWQDLRSNLFAMIQKIETALPV